MRNIINFLFTLLLVLIPIVFFWKSSEVFEFNKMVVVYLFTILIVASWFIRMIIEKRFIFRKTLLDIPLLLFLGSQVVSTIFSIDVHTSIFGYYSRFHGGLLSTVCYLLLYWAFVTNITRDQLLHILKYFLVSVIFASIWAALEHFGNSPSCILINGEFNIGCWKQYERGAERVFGTMGQPNWLAALLVATAPFTWHKITNKEKNSKSKFKYLWFGSAVVIFATLLFTRSRSGIIAYTAITLLYGSLTLLKDVFKSTSHTLNFALLNFLLIFVALTIGTPWTPALSDVVKKSQPKNEVVTTTVLDTGGTESGDIRKIVWEGAFNLWQKYPIFGSGVETFAYGYYETRPAKHNETSEWDYLYNKAHNEYLNVLATTGIVGLNIYIVLIIAIIAQILNLKNLNLNNLEKIINTDASHTITLLCAFISLLITNFFGFSVVATGLLFFLLPAFAVSLTTPVETEKKHSLTDYQKVSLGLVVIITSYLLIVVGRYWYADLLFAKSKHDLNRDFKAILADATQASKISPQESLYHNQLSNLYASLATTLTDRGVDGAEKYAELAHMEGNLALSLSPRNVTIQRSQANILTELGAVDAKYLLEAAKLHDTIIYYAPTDAKAFYKAGLGYFRLGQNQKAAELFATALELKPNYQEAKTGLETVTK